jgi:hypothetical protein
LPNVISVSDSRGSKHNINSSIARMTMFPGRQGGGVAFPPIRLPSRNNRLQLHNVGVLALLEKQGTVFALKSQRRPVDNASVILAALPPEQHYRLATTPYL